MKKVLQLVSTTKTSNYRQSQKLRLTLKSKDRVMRYLEKQLRDFKIKSKILKRLEYKSSSLFHCVISKFF